MLKLGPRPKIVGIVNVTPDSFSDGGRYLEPPKAIEHARELRTAGADVIELGAASSHPDSGKISPADELGRLAPVLSQLSSADFDIGLDSTQPEVQTFGIKNGVRFLNDIRGFPDSSIYDVLATSSCMLVVMHSVSRTEHADRRNISAQSAFDSACRFFEERLRRLTERGIALDRIILDPGMGFFLSSNPEPSLAMLAHLPSIHQRFGLPLFVSVSRKSFLRNLMPSETCDLRIRTIAAELFLRCMPVAYIRTHDVAVLNEGLATLEAIVRSRDCVRAPG
ncbi:MAG: dihydropteroate synthase [Betaproteobacteria bacterium]|nr:MAG: dihydropteroate synthase [Betaproteobacteria bacterium]